MNKDGQRSKNCRWQKKFRGYNKGHLYDGRRKKNIGGDKRGASRWATEPKVLQRYATGLRCPMNQCSTGIAASDMPRICVFPRPRSAPWLAGHNPDPGFLGNVCSLKFLLHSWPQSRPRLFRERLPGFCLKVLYFYSSFRGLKFENDLLILYMKFVIMNVKQQILLPGKVKSVLIIINHIRWTIMINGNSTVNFVNPTTHVAYSNVKYSQMQSIKFLISYLTPGIIGST